MRLTGRAIPRFPAQVTGGPGIGVTKASGIWSIGLDTANLIQQPLDDPVNSYVAVLLPDGSYAKIPIAVVSNPYAPLITAPVAGEDATALIQDAINTYGWIQLEHGGVYQICSTISFPDNSGLLGNGATIYCPASCFNNTNSDIDHRYGTNSVALAMFGSTTDYALPVRNITLRDLRVVGDYVDGTHTHIVCARNVDGLVIDNVEIAGFAVGIALTIASCRNFKVTRCNFNTYYSNISWGGATSAQATGLEVDNDLVATTSSKWGIISKNIIRGFTKGATAIAADGYQTDAINLVNGHGLVVADNHLSFVDEGIDTFAEGCSLCGNVIEDVSGFGIKLVHGASYNSISGGLIQRAGYAGLILTGGAPGGNVEQNMISGLVIRDIDPNAIGLGSRACIQLGTDSAGNQIINNTIADVICDPGANGQYDIYLTGLQATSGNRIHLRSVAAGSLGWVGNSGAIPGNTIIAVDHPSLVRVRLSGNQTISSAADLINFDTVDYDARGEFNTTTHLWTCQIPGKYRVVLRGRGALANGALHTLNIKYNAGVIATGEFTAPSASAFSIPTAETTLTALVGGTLSFTAGVSAASFALTANTVYTYAEIEYLAN